MFWGPGTHLEGILRPMEAEGRLIGGPGAEPPGISPVLALLVAFRDLQSTPNCDLEAPTFGEKDIGYQIRAECQTTSLATKRQEQEPTSST